MKIGVLNLGDLWLEAPISWTFFQMGAIVLARRVDHVGSLQLTLAYRNSLHAEVSAAACLGELMEFMNCEDHTQLEEVNDSREDGLVTGAATIRNGETFRRGWYRFKNNQLVLALYECSTEPRESSAAQAELADCEIIAGTMELRPG